jgi:hypothetical protein
MFVGLIIYIYIYIYIYPVGSLLSIRQSMVAAHDSICPLV